jgi:hypothetical protein
VPPEPIRAPAGYPDGRTAGRGGAMNSIIYIIGLIVVVLAILSFLGLR